jgi:hypothetical protein
MDPSWQEENPYWYGFSNPINHSDPGGLSPKDHTIIYEWRKCETSNVRIQLDQSARCVVPGSERWIPSTRPSNRGLGTIINNNRILTHGHGKFGRTTE